MQTTEWFRFYVQTAVTDISLFLLYQYDFFKVMHILTQLKHQPESKNGFKTLIYPLYFLLYKKGKLILALLEDIKSRSFSLQ